MLTDIIDQLVMKYDVKEDLRELTVTLTEYLSELERYINKTAKMSFDFRGGVVSVSDCLNVVKEHLFLKDCENPSSMKILYFGVGITVSFMVDKKTGKVMVLDYRVDSSEANSSLSYVNEELRKLIRDMKGEVDARF